MVQEGFKHKLIAILSSDVKGYSRLIRQDERGTIRISTAFKAAVIKFIPLFIVTFWQSLASVVDSVNCGDVIEAKGRIDTLYQGFRFT